jgi:hypothetical protein
VLEYRYVGFPRYDSRAGSGYGSIAGKKGPSIGTSYSMSKMYPYKEPPKEVEDSDGEGILKFKLKKKLQSKTNFPARKNDPFSQNWTDRGSFVNLATRLDLSERKYFPRFQSVLQEPYQSSLGGIDKFHAMGNGAGIYKTGPGKRIGMNIGGMPKSFAAKKTDQTIPPSLLDFLKAYIDEKQ